MLTMHEENFPCPLDALLRDAAPLSLALIDAARLVTARLDALTSGPYMTAAQARVLRHIEHKTAGMSLGELASLAGISTTATSQMMQRVGRFGHVSLSEGPWDTRVRLVTLQPRGLREYQRIMRGHARFDRLLGVWIGADRVPDMLADLGAIRARADG
jgi:DNA-binding MarR family transcriptional regulator